MKKIVSLIVLVVILGAAVTMNPSKEEHMVVVKEYMTNEVNDLVPGTGSGFLGKLTKIAGGLIGSALEENVVYHNYFVFSTTELIVGDTVKPMTWGAFGHVSSRVEKSDE